MYSDFLTNGTEEQKDAFMAGCSMMMDIFNHSHTNDYAMITSRRDPAWILMLCEKEENRIKDEQRSLVDVMLRYYEFDRAKFRGLVLNCNAINDDGQEIDDEGKPCKGTEYPYRYYCDTDGNEYEPEDYVQLTLEEQEKLDEVFSLELKSKDGGESIWIDSDDLETMPYLLERLLANEPVEITELYMKAYKDGTSPIVVAYAKVFENDFEATDFAVSQAEKMAKGFAVCFGSNIFGSKESTNPDKDLKDHNKRSGEPQGA